ncbi:class I SAM-dependent DNA methyltransferase [Stutzerimonas stutzeri]|uniref:class I SAM-dependent DNA methyltransferase n=2 Tax=Gammaproteobacteria TaxID=1236 RepID=UPI000F7ACBD5|nr:DNA methyltransferase [Stutzerimonas stutzeri]MDH2242735.1 N-6 DNA methylase [Pseudomonas sp. GD03909]RRW11068.1 class I SAM-dependent DNA methyltransferase [Stutzerimonas stutzeri]RSH63917.1 class I SAM-dependent DNA methyltransferase [Stutzerimonas stutzeri]CAB5520470.1 Type I restriction-modification system methyltransferase subunit [Stutzerimonas stutzeri]CAB5548900.1 Type I restriction-modification system methyltransferase subunit [Stutzerimonas stutzeri]
MNAVEIESAISDLALEPFDAAEFPFTFLAAFGRKDAEIKRLRAGNNNASDVPGGVLLRNNIHIAACEPGTVGETLKALRTSLATTKAKAKFILATDGQTLEAEELITGETITCDYPDLPNHFGFLLPLAGISTIKEIKDNPIDVRATGRLNKLYVELLNENPDWAKAERRADMNHFMARLVFCFFAEDTDIFHGDGLFTKTVEQFSERDGSNTDQVLSEIFRAMNIKLAERASAEPRLPGWANKFPYVNGGLFSGSTETPRFTRMARTYLLHAGNLNWKKINPDIFGSMIQAVADDEERGALGMHYTSVPNILKVLNPLFLDDLRAQLDAAGDNKAKLLNLRKRMAHIRVFDPACGSGNFLVIAYKQMREIEAEINLRRGESNNKSEIPLTNFRGIELRDFPAEIARLALIIAEFQCDVLYRGQQDALAEFLPLDAQNWIVCGNALRLDWLSLMDAHRTGVKLVADDLFDTPLDQAEIDFENEGGEIYLCANPPYQGSVNQTAEQKEDMARIFSPVLKNYKDLDYVAAFVLKAAQFNRLTNSSSAFVTTNSVTQGEQVGMLWPLVFKERNFIFFAHTSFLWSNLASNKAAVTCVILGLSSRPRGEKKLFDEETVRNVPNISPYLVATDTVIVTKRSRALSEIGHMQSGNKPTDGGALVLSTEEKDQILARNPEAAHFIKHYVGSRELINGGSRWCIWVEDAELAEASKIQDFRTRFERVRQQRLSSDGVQANDNANTPHRFVFAPHSSHRAVAVPNASSERRPYLPCEITDYSTVVSNLASVIYNAPIWSIALIASRLHLVWVGTVCGKLKTDFRYSNTLGWNTFPVPLLTEQNKTDLTRCAEDILLAREAHFPATIADLYDPDTMPENLRHAHERNDEVLERIYIGRRFKNDTERLEKLFDLYTKMTADTAKAAPKKPRGKKA